MFVFYFAILSAITPPVAIAVSAACGISRSEVWATSYAAVKLGLTGYIIPFMFVFGPSLLLVGTWDKIALTVVTSTIGVSLLAGGLAGYFLGPATVMTRLLFLAAAFTLIKPGLVTDAVGLTLGAAGLFLNWRFPAPDRVPDAATAGVGPVEAPASAPIEPTDYNEAPAAHTTRGAG